VTPLEAENGLAMTNHIDRLPEIAKAETVIGTYPDLSSSDGRGKEPPSFSKIASGNAAILWIECEAWIDAHELKRLVTLATS
jgi:hypothetical protein